MLVGGQHGNTPLHHAAGNKKCQVVEILIAAGAEMNAKNNVRLTEIVPGAPLVAAADSVLLGGQNDRTPLHRAASAAKQNNSQDMVKLLEAAGAR